MRRIDPRSGRGGGGLFRGYELTRLMAGTLLLGIIGLYYFQAVNPKTWTGIARDDTAPSDEHQLPVDPATVAAWKETLVPLPEGALPADPEELDAFKEEAQVIEDRKLLSLEEMFSYWRLFNWARSESSAEMEQRARRDLFFTHFVQAPATYRGTLARLRLNVTRVLPQADLKQNPAGVTEIFEVWGTTNDSQSFPFVVIVPERPPQLPLGVNLVEQAVFTGYFHKLMAYNTADGKTHYSPLLIGRIRWLENPVTQHYKRQANASSWIIGGVIGVILIVLATQWWYSRSIQVRLPEKAVDEKALNRWMETGEIPASPADDTEWMEDTDPPDRRSPPSPS